jgi:SAM-dependent methyltransferase
MPNIIHKAWNYVYYRLVHAPRGGGKPVPPDALDHEYRSGNWDHFLGPDELVRHELLLELIYARGDTFSLLDLGCGSGRLASMVDTSRLNAYLGVDLSDEGLSRSQALNLPHGRFLKGNFEEWRPTESFDVITFNECLGYARVPAETAASMARHLKPGGVLIVSHFRWGNHEAVWASLDKYFTVVDERTARNDKGSVWDIRSLQLRS